jgi:hypothetical protein
MVRIRRKEKKMPTKLPDDFQGTRVGDYHPEWRKRPDEVARGWKLVILWLIIVFVVTGLVLAACLFYTGLHWLAEALISTLGARGM